MTHRVIGLIANTEKPGAEELVEKIHAEFIKHNVKLNIEEDTAKLINEKTDLSTAQVAAGSELLLVLGGDGTILHVVHEMGDSLRPVFGVNLGSLGFLTCASSGEWMAAVTAVLKGSYRLTHRSRLCIEIERDGEMIARRTGLNDVVISRGYISRLVKLETLVNGYDLTSYNADGLIVSTPTGSTAYSLAAGGPVLMPNSGVFVVTPICPHVLTNRSLIVGDDSIVEVRSVRSQDDVFVTVDGQDFLSLHSEDRVKIRRADQPLQLAMLPDTSFFSVLRGKLKWSGTAV